MTVTPADSTDDIPTLPTRSRSGRAINAVVIRAMAAQLEASKAAHEALDHLEKVASSPPPPKRVAGTHKR